MKYGKREMRRNYNRKGLTALVAAVLLFCCTVGGTLAWLATSTGDVVNTFTPAKIETTIEEPEGTAKTNVTIKNADASIDAYIRATIVINWVDGEGNIYGIPPVKGEDYTEDLNVDEGEEWFAVDGIYYHRAKVAAGTSTAALINEIKPKEAGPDGYYFQVTILTEAIQADGKNSDGTPAVELAWTDVKVDGSDNLTKSVS